MGYDFIAKKRIWFIISVAIIILGLISFLMKWGLEYGIDFRNMTLFEVNFKEPIKINVVRDTLKKHGFDVSVIQSVDDTKYQIEMITSKEEKDRIKKIFLETGLLKGEIVENNIIPFHVEDILVKITYSILISGVILFLIILVRTGFRLALVSLMTTIINLLLTLGVFSILKRKISVFMTMSILAISIFSVVVIINVVNRINKNKFLIKKRGYKEILNLSLNQISGTLVIVLICLMIPIFSLIFYSCGIFRNLAIFLASGFVVITFSSIFTMGCLLTLLNKYFPKYK